MIAEINDLKNKLELKEKELLSIIEGSKHVLGKTSFESSSRAIFDQCCDLIGATSGYVALLSEDGSENKVLFLENGGMECTVDPELPMPIRGLRAVAYENNSVEYDNDFMNSEWVKMMPEGHMPLNNVLFTPLIVNGKTVGIMGMANKDGDFTERDKRLSAVFGELAAISLSNSLYLDELNATKDKLEESLDRFSRLAENLPDAIYRMSLLDGTYEFMSHSSEKIFGFTPDEFYRSPRLIQELIHPDFKEYFALEWEKLQTGEMPPTYEYKIVNKSGETKWLNQRNTLVRDVSGKPCFIEGIVTDVTEQRRLHDQIIHMERTNRSLLDHSPASHKIVDPDFKLRYMNKNGFCMLKLDPSTEVYGKPYPFDFFPESHKEILLNSLQKVLETGEEVSFEDLSCDVEGNKVWLNHNLIPVFNDDTISFITVVSANVTKRKKLEEMQLRSSQLSALGEVASGVAHEINNPIQGVINYAQLLINKNDENDKSNQILRKIIREGDRIASIVKNLLNFSQKDRHEFSYLNLIDIVVEPVNLHSQLLKNDGIHFEVGIPDDLPKIYGNQMQLEQVTLNLLSNARHALNKKFPDLSKEKFIVITAESSSNKSGRSVELKVKDYGCGIHDDVKDKIFNPFFTTKEAGVGTGLGLSVSHEILEKHGSEISINSEVGRFTEVTITFPVNPEAIS